MTASLENAAVKAQVAPKAVVALLNVSDVQRSVGFYEKLGFELGNELKNEHGVVAFAWMHRGSAAQIMISRSGKLLSPTQGVMFYLYARDMPAYREQLIARGVEVSKVTYPFWSPGGEFQVNDPDGWIWIVC